MDKKVILGSFFVLLLAGLFLFMWRSHVMGPAARFTPGGLIAVSASGTPMPFPDTLAAVGTLPPNRAAQESGGLLVTLALNPYPPTVTKPHDFAITLTDQQGQAISDATIRLDLTMPGMMMPPNQFDLEPAGAGLYHARGLFSMRGPWRIEAIITLAGRTQSVFFNLWL
jgi:hypothetical protein